MKLSKMWLYEWVNPSIDNTELMNQLTMAGFTVDTLKPVSNNTFYGVVIGEIIECKIHPNFKNIRILKVNNGSKNLINIICDDISCRKNIKVAVANIGALLPNGNEVKLNIIHGELSEGILCTFSMLGIINNAESSIIEIPKNAPIGKNFYDYLCLHDKTININVTPNRGDCLSIIGIAREIAVINRMKLKKIETYIIKPTIKDTISIVIESPKACPQLLTRIIKKINIMTPTPLWIKEKLRRCDIQSINIIADITNYVLIELGHPVHVFDYEKIEDHTIKIRLSKSGETLSLSTNNVLKLFNNTLIITDTKKILSLAGIIVSNQSCVCSNTHNIILQSAFFNPSIIANQSKMYNIHTLSSIRYARGVDPNISQLALDRVTFLLLKNCNGDPGAITNITNNYLLPISKPIILHRSKINKILGFHIPNNEIIRILKNLGFQIKFEQNNNSWKILSPTWRFDIFIEENVIAEIIRIYGYKKIPNIATNTKLTISHCYKPIISLSKIKNLLVARGYQEIITYSFVNPKIQKLLYPTKIPLTLKNPITLEMSSMRLSLWIGLIETMIYNQNRQQKNIKLFESGMCFIPQNSDNNQINEKFMIAGIRSGLRFNEYWNLKTHPVDFYDIKGDIEALLHITNKINHITFKNSTHPALHPQQNAAIFLNNNTCIGHIGMIHPMIQNQLNLQSHMLVFELTWNMLSKFTLPKITDISKFPKNYRDISIIISNNISAESIIQTCKKTIGNQLIDIKISDVYNHTNIPKNCKSLTIKLCLQNKTHTLQETEIYDILNKCVISLKKRFQAILR